MSKLLTFQPSELISISEGWFHFPVRVYPHHTDYAGIVWHGSYIAWMEEVRVECLRLVELGFEELVATGCDLPVVNMSLNYHHSVKMGETIVVKAKLAPLEKLRINWSYEIRTQQHLCVTANVSLVAVDRKKGRVIRTLPANMQDAIAQLLALQSSNSTLG